MYRRVHPLRQTSCQRCRIADLEVAGCRAGHARFGKGAAALHGMVAEVALAQLDAKEEHGKEDEPKALEAAAQAHYHARSNLSPSQCLQCSYYCRQVHRHVHRDLQSCQRGHVQGMCVGVCIVRLDMGMGMCMDTCEDKCLDIQVDGPDDIISRA